MKRGKENPLEARGALSWVTALGSPLRAGIIG